MTRHEAARRDAITAKKLVLKDQRTMQITGQMRRPFFI